MYYLRICLYLFAGNNFMMILPSACHLWILQVSMLHPAMGARSYETRRMFHRGKCEGLVLGIPRSSKELLIILVVTGILGGVESRSNKHKIMKFTGCFVQHLQVVQDVSSTESNLNNNVFFPEKAGVSRWLPGDISHFTQKYPLCHGSTRPQKFQILPTSYLYIFANGAKITYL